MGEDKSRLIIDDEPLAARIARLLREAGLTVTVCGREAIDSCALVLDAEDYAGPLAALSAFRAEKEFVFIASCDLPGFDAGLVPLLRDRIGGHEAAIPVAEGKPQPLCALYKASALCRLRELAAAGERRIMTWIETLDYLRVTDIDPSWIRNVNTPEDWRSHTRPVR
jgi:molybdopterin-guanine dinucleotide biosynthesis protein A